MRHTLIVTLMLSAALAGILNGVRTYMKKKLYADALAAAQPLRPADDEVLIPSMEPIEDALPPLPAVGSPTEPDNSPWAVLRGARELLAQGALQRAESTLVAAGSLPEFHRDLAKLRLFQRLTDDVQPHEFWDGSGLVRLQLKDGSQLDVRRIRELEGGGLVRLGNGSQMFVASDDLLSEAPVSPEGYRAELAARFDALLAEAHGSLTQYRVARFAAEHRLRAQMVQALETALGKGEALVLFEVNRDVDLRDLWCEAYNVRLVVEKLPSPEPASASEGPRPVPASDWDSKEAFRLYRLGLEQYRAAYQQSRGRDLKEAEATLRQAKRLANARLDENEEDPEAIQLASQINELLLDILKLSELSDGD